MLKKMKMYSLVYKKYSNQDSLGIVRKATWNSRRGYDIGIMNWLQKLLAYCLSLNICGLVAR